MLCKHCKKSGWHLVAYILVIIGGLNWGLVGFGLLIGGNANLNVINLLLGRVPVIEGIVYLLVGLAALSLCFGCRGKKCLECVGCAECQAPEAK